MDGMLCIGLVFGQFSCLELLLSSSEEESLPKLLSARDNQGRTFAHLAVWGGHLPILNFLLSKVTTIHLNEDYNGRTALHLASRRGKSIV